ncbi:hypothetical protein, partial [Bradyrhizobium sp.]|uniref:hypothetical protein n=1 Tax=Bradyrhizobium sp. TaxID=376 RepID=UPI003C4941E1
MQNPGSNAGVFVLGALIVVTGSPYNVRHSLKPDVEGSQPLCACVERPCDGPAAGECSEFAPSRAELPIDGEPYQRQRCAS